jgi:hypothetical protein
MSHVEMTEIDKIDLWRQRLFEVEAGMTIFVTRQGSGPHISKWLAAKARIFANFPAEDCADVATWQGAFFRAQALCEQFISGNFGERAMARWVLANASVYQAIDADRGLEPPPDAIRRVARQAALYGSDYEIVEESASGAEVLIAHCAIWDYRELARARGVPITLKSPCTYCTKAMSANIRAKGCFPQFELFDRGHEHGCRWRAVDMSAPHADAVMAEPPPRKTPAKIPA